ncbi:hypothetical protein MGG_17446 [Pyricularia oryzae 70-15]|uniref:Uncharacterized protein n=3 Tax=Pyricularia oryzae TaxID=318829 RepID=G4NBR7_PYRO7|nr:uncharacterized protein MGG_17446 [Pyricularia oryzae 70-15]EHA48975.1 hypothetical protein MGG_17446 [Pyricularia oryzae 70-15]ELQ42519.1 hypothetical protein OOU_Y34scaffold00203g8 [Pyricularia oryzae Y34]
MSKRPERNVVKGTVRRISTIAPVDSDEGEVLKWSVGRQIGIALSPAGCIFAGDGVPDD